MARNEGVTISVKIPIKWEVMTERTRQRLRQTVGRDARVIRAFLGVIEEHEDELLVGRRKNRIDDGKLDQLTMTAIRVKAGYSQRLTVPHDFKVRFPRISRNELTECRQTAVQMYEGYLELRRKKRRRVSRPCKITSSRRIPRWVFSQRFSLVEHNTAVARWWIDLRDSFDSVPEKRRVHDRLLIPLRMSPFHLNQIDRGEVKALQIFTDRHHKWWVTLAVRVDVPESETEGLPLAVLGIDLGVRKAACTALVTPEKVRETRYFVQNEKVARIEELDQLVANLQHEYHSRKNDGHPTDKIAKRLRSLRSKRENVAREYDRVLVRQLVDYISDLSEQYHLYVAIGRLKHIRAIARRGNYRGRRFRGMVHSWAFARITEELKYQLAQLGWPVAGKQSRFRAIPEGWTSIICWKCGHRGRRPKQNYFVCPTCGNRCNADRNGAINIAGRYITLTSSLHDVRGLGKWASAVARSSRPKTRGKTGSSRRRSLLSTKGTTSGPGESAAVHPAQSSLLDVGDDIEMGDHDPAVGSTAETLTVVGSDAPAQTQEEETRSVGGIPSP
ncbi:transposase [Candidatus Thorarchaeota archaeon]|nr:MAG: transposase [Candidatus Thorarchaeota archaeon]